MITFAFALITGIFLAAIYWGLLIVPTIGSFPFFSQPLVRMVMGSMVRLGVVALAAVCMLHYGLNHLILMMIVFYTALVVIMIAYKGGLDA